jgi:hypothetical protein
MFITHATTEIPKLYKENKKFGRLIRNNTFYVNNNDIKGHYKITHIKYCETHFDLRVNIKIAGTWSFYDWRGGNRETCLTKGISIRQPRARNRDIRWAIKEQVKSYFNLMGVPQYNVNIGTISIKESL